MCSSGKNLLFPLHNLFWGTQLNKRTEDVPFGDTFGSKTFPLR